MIRPLGGRKPSANPTSLLNDAPSNSAQNYFCPTKPHLEGRAESHETTENYLAKLSEGPTQATLAKALEAVSEYDLLPIR